jgi:hypothetical protein
MARSKCVCCDAVQIGHSVKVAGPRWKVAEDQEGARFDIYSNIAGMRKDNIKMYLRLMNS